jgi:hypothetical protein
LLQCNNIGYDGGFVIADPHRNIESAGAIGENSPREESGSSGTSP